MGVEFAWFAELQEDIYKFEKTNASDLGDAMQMSAMQIARYMRQIAPEDSGRLKNSIGVGKVEIKNGDRVTVTVGSHRKDWGEGDYYPPYVEFGHAGPNGGAPTPPHPYIRPAYDAKKEEYVDSLKKRLNEKWR